VKTECASLLQLNVCIRKPWLAASSHPKPSIVLSHGLSRLASRKDCMPAIRDSKPRLWGLRWLLSDLKCAYPFLAGAFPLTPLGELTTLIYAYKSASFI